MDGCYVCIADKSLLYTECATSTPGEFCKAFPSMKFSLFVLSERSSPDLHVSRLVKLYLNCRQRPVQMGESVFYSCCVGR